MNKNGLEIEDYVFAISEQESAQIERPLEKKRIRLFWWLMLAVFTGLFGRVAYLNIVRGGHYQEMARDNRIREISIKAPRGKIYDRAGSLLVNNVPSMDVAVVAADLPADREALKQVIRLLSEILIINEGELIGRIDSVDRQAFGAILIKENISQEESLKLAEKKAELPGVIIELTAIRDYADSQIFSHLLGYEGKIQKQELKDNPDYSLTDYIGKQGIEKQYEKYLKGVNGAYQIEVDSLGNVRKERGIISPKPGQDLVLNIDAELQKKIFDSLTGILEKSGTKTAAAVALNPQNGEVLALVSLPSYDNNLFAQSLTQEQYLSLINNPDKPLFNRVLAGKYPPGSTIKPLIAAAALTEGTIDEHSSVTCQGAIHIGSFRFGDWNTHGVTDVRKAIAESCDVFFYSVGGGYGNIAGLGMSRMKKYEEAFGLGRPTGIDLPGEDSGFIPDEKWKLERLEEKWYIGNSYHASIGQGYLTTTPMQLANYVAAIANGGYLYKPQLARQIRGTQGEKTEFPKQLISDELANQEAIRIAREGMRQTVTSGTAQPLGTLPVATAGKTGTAQFGTEDKTHAWFVSFAPYEKPEIAMVVLVEGGGEGHSSAVPVTREVYQWYFGEERKNGSE